MSPEFRPAKWMLDATKRDRRKELFTKVFDFFAFLVCFGWVALSSFIVIYLIAWGWANYV
jgi:hypothetical protein